MIYTETLISVKKVSIRIKQHLNFKKLPNITKKVITLKMSVRVNTNLCLLMGH